MQRQARAELKQTTGTYYRTAGERQWFVIDASGLVLGRLASRIALRLRGKHRPDFTPHADSGDGVIVINAERIALTGNKRDQKVYHRHTGHPGGIKATSAKAILDGRFPERVVMSAVERMMPDGPLGRKQFARLRVYPGSSHPHEAQEPQIIDFGAMNPKNIAILERRDIMPKENSPIVEQIRERLQGDFDAVRVEIGSLKEVGEETNRKLAALADDVHTGIASFGKFQAEQRAATDELNKTLRLIVEKLIPS